MGFGKYDKRNSLPNPSRFEDRIKAEEKKKALIQQMLDRGKRKREAPEPEKGTVTTAAPSQATPAVVVEEKPRPVSPLSRAHYGQASVPIYDRDLPNVPLGAEPWLRSLVNALLEVSVQGGLRLVLLWPGTVESPPLVHSLACLERLAIGDKKGVRAILYPTKKTSFLALNHLLFDRKALERWGRHYMTLAGTAVEQPLRDNQDLDWFLSKLATIDKQAPQSPSPTIAELMPHFYFDKTSSDWGSYAKHYLARTMLWLDIKHRREIRDSLRLLPLSSPSTAPNAIFSIGHRAKKYEIRATLKSEAFSGDARPQIVVADATKGMRRTSERSVRRIPEFIEAVRSRWEEVPGFLVVTDDPITFFTFRKDLAAADSEARKVTTQVFISENDDYGLSQTPKPDNYVPATVSLRNFPVMILDREAAETAERFWSIASHFERDTAQHNACREAAFFLLSIANLPGGYRDFMAWLESTPRPQSVIRKFTWPGHETTLLALVESGQFGERSDAVKRAIAKAKELIAYYGPHTPMSLRLTKELATLANKRKQHIVVVLRANSHVPVAKRFFESYEAFPGGVRFADFADRVEFITHYDLPNRLKKEPIPERYVLVGLPDQTLRLLLTSEEFPVRTLVLIDFSRAFQVERTLQALRTLDELKPYYGRIGGLATELKKHIDEMPTAIKTEGPVISRFSLNPNTFAESPDREDAAESWKIDLEDGHRIYVGNRVYVYEPDEESAFHSRATEELRPGDSIFVMSEKLKDLFESCLHEAGFQLPRGSSLIDLLRAYHREVSQRSQQLFPASNRTQQAKAILREMQRIEPAAEDCSLNRVIHWLRLEEAPDTPDAELKPQASRSYNFFVAFAKALRIPEELIGPYWLVASDQRNVLRQAGRELSERYSHILFTPEVAQVRFHLNQETIRMLQHEALRNIHEIKRVIRPLTDAAGDNDG